MNWIKKTLKIGEKIKTLLKRRPTPEETENSDWTSCCGPVLKKDMEINLWVCPACNKHHRLSCKQRFDIFFSKNNYEILNTPTPQEVDILRWKDTKSYKDRLKAARKKTGMNCAVMIVKSEIDNIKVTAAASDMSFIGASIGAAEGEALLTGIQHAIDNKQPFINFTSGGGMRMYENLISLSQMTRVTLAINELKKNNLPYIVVMCDATTGGITASYAMLGDINLAEPNALVAFAGARVIKGTVNEELPEGFQKSEYVLKTGFIDLIVERSELKRKIGSILSILLKKNSDINLKNLNETSEINIKTREAS